MPISKQSGEWATNLRQIFRRRIRVQFTGLMIFAIVLTLLLCFGMNTGFLTNYYINSKTESMAKAYDELNAKVSDGSIYKDSYKVDFERLCSNLGVTIIVTKANGSVRLSSAGDSAALSQQLQYIVLDADLYDSEIILTKASYTIARQMDTRLDEEYLVLWGNLLDGSIIMIRTPLAGIEESANISNTFLLYTAVIGIIVGVIFASLMANRITRPIYKIADLSKKMAELEFDEKYTPQKHPNEIDELGENMNELSEALEITINKLQVVNEELKKDIRLKEEDEAARKDFISSVSHELKTPISLIQGYAEGLSEGIMDDEESRQFYLEVIVDEAKRMNRLVRELLTLNQLEAGYNDGELESFDIIQVVAGVIDSSRLLLEQEGISITYPFDEEVYVKGDEFLIEQVVSNYISNAIHHCKDDKIITVNYTKEYGKIKLCVFNTGDNIPEKDINHIWEKFYKVDKARTREYGGSGIGLSVVKAVMDRHNQKFGVENQEDGVEFWFELKQADDLIK